jgi:carboxypeptidase family protein
MQAIPTANRRARHLGHLAIATALAVAVATGRPAGAQATPAAPAQFSVLQGFVLDSIHDGGLAKAVVIVEGTGRSSVTEADGRFRVDSIPMGRHRIMVMHPLLDTIGVVMRTPDPLDFSKPVQTLDLSLPSGERLASVFCSAAQRARGPALMLGFVRDPDSNGPALGAKVSLVFQTTDVIGRKQPATVREMQVDSAGLYRICGLPADMTGKVQVYRNGVSSGEVPIEVKRGIALRAFSVAAKQVVAEVTNDSGKVRKVAKGTARVTGKVVDKTGKPLSGARVQLQDGVAVAITKPNGEFTLDSLPSGTQALVVRKLGYGVTESAVELSSATPARTTVTMSDFVPTLQTVRVEAQVDKALQSVGYLERKQTGMGNFLDGNQINHQSLMFSDVMRTVPGLRVQPSGDGRTSVITDSRNAANGCVNYFVDDQPWTTMTPGDIDDFVRPNEMVAVEVYHGSTAPPRYQIAGQSSCAVVVIWTQAKMSTLSNRKKP